MSWLSKVIALFTGKKPAPKPAPIVVAPPLPIPAPQPAPVPAPAPAPAAPPAPSEPSPVPTPSPAPVVVPARRLVVGVGSHGSPDEGKIIAGLGLKHVRVTFYTAPAMGQTYESFRGRLRDLRSHGLEPLVVVHDFARTPSDAAKVLAEIAKAFPGTAIQVGNEFDAEGYRGAQYAELMRAVLPAMRIADPTCRIVGMGLSSTDGQPWSRTPDVERQSTFTREYLAAGGLLLDAWCLHAYGNPLGKAVTARVEAVQAVLQGKMPLYLTECGTDRDWLERTDGPLSDSEIDRLQAVEVVDALEAAQKLGVERVYLFQTWDNTDYNFGLLRADAKTERPVCEAVRKFVGTQS